MAFTSNFVFTDPVAAQQAVQYAQLANQEQAQADQAFNDRIRTGTQGRISQQNAQQQMLMNQSQMQQQAAEREKDRVSNQTIAGIQAGPREDAIKARQAADALANKAFALDNFNRGTSFAQTLNDPKTPLSLKQKLMQSGDVEMGPDGLWRSRHANPNPVESIDDIRGRVTVPVPGTVVEPGRWFGSNPVAGGVVGSKIPAAMDSMPSRARMLQMGPPPPDPVFPSAPPGPSPFETPGFRIFRQSDIMNRTVPVTEVPVDQPWMQSGYY